MSADADEARRLVERLRRAGIGEPARWRALARKLDGCGQLNAEEAGYLASLARTYGRGITRRSRIYHHRLSIQDRRPPCRTCRGASAFYCNMNDAYYCEAHVVGHDENEL